MNTLLRRRKRLRKKCLLKNGKRKLRMRRYVFYVTLILTTESCYLANIVRILFKF
jgi:hypothetical protein